VFLDVRLPLGAMFSIFGATIGAYGAFVGGDGRRLFGADVDVAWGGALLAFGLTMLGLAARSRSARQRAASAAREEGAR
jgi:hypothetical protein